MSDVLPEVPLNLESILQKALRKNSDERYQTIREMLADLRNLKGELEAEGSSTQTKVRAESIVSKIKRHKQGVLLTVAAAILASAAFVYSFFLVAPAPSPDEKSIAVLPFENLSSDKENAYFADGHSRRDPDSTREDRRAQGHLAHFDATLWCAAGQPVGNCASAWGGKHPRRQCAKGWRPSAH